MIDTTTMPPKNVLPPTAVARNARELLSDGVHLAELQMQLVSADWRLAQRRFIAIVACAVAALLLVLTLLPIAFACAALALWELAGLSLAASFAIVLGVGVLLIAACALTIWLLARNSDSLFHESRREFTRNLNWLKNTIRGTT
jgi:uncharacterized membrane protein (DUF485 family)